jgi:hypothetical protein
MSGASPQAPTGVVMIRPHTFAPNPETRADNAFQADDPTRTASDLAADAYAEVTTVAKRLEDEGVRVHLFEDETGVGADSVFPNNWFSTHAGGHVALYPMFSPSRRTERRSDVVEMLKHTYRVQDVIDYSGLEQDDVFLEGTGAMALDHVDRIAYAARSNRTNPVALERFCTHFNFEPMLFDATDPNGRAIYHTNVLMCIGTEFALIGLSAIADDRRRNEVRDRLLETGREVIDLSPEQVASFAGNAIELTGRHGRLLAMSNKAHGALTAEQLAGGSIRCMMAWHPPVPPSRLTRAQVSSRR